MNTLLTLEEFKLFYPFSSLTDPQIKLYLEIVTELLHDMAGVSLEEGEITEILRGNNQNTLYIKKRPITQIIECSSNKNNLLLNEITINLAKNGITRQRGIFLQGQDIHDPYMASKTTTSEIVKIKYIGGYKYPSDTEKGNVPTSLKYALAGLVDSLSGGTTGEQQDKLKSYSRDDVSYTFRDKMETDQKFYDVISRYISW